jgi:hypothetical protein
VSTSNNPPKLEFQAGAATLVINPQLAAITPEPGPKTTEFWQTLLSNIIAVGVAVFALFGHRFPTTGASALAAPAAAFASAIVTGLYARSRGGVKQAAHAANGQLQIAQSQMVNALTRTEP